MKCGMFVCHCNQCLSSVDMTFIPLRITIYTCTWNRPSVDENEHTWQTITMHIWLWLCLWLWFCCCIFSGFHWTNKKNKSILFMFSSAKHYSDKHAQSLQTSNPHMEWRQFNHFILFHFNMNSLVTSYGTA